MILYITDKYIMANDKRENTRCPGSLLMGGYSVSIVTIYMVHYFIILIKKKTTALAINQHKLSNA